MHGPSSSNPDVDPSALLRQLAPYRQSDIGRSLLELGITITAFAVFWVLTCVSLAAGHMIGMLLSVPAGVFLLRLFLIQHDCGHGAFFKARSANDWLGRALGILTLTPYECWRRSHAVHHANTGNLDARGVGDVDTLTVAEFYARSPLRRLLYRFYRCPLVLFGLGPAYLFLLRHRLPIGMMRCGWRPWLSAMGTNAGIVGGALALISIIGGQLFFLVHLPIVLVASTLGVWFFYVQHQFEQTEWDRDSNWTFHTAALRGSSYYDLPRAMHWLTANVGIHHVHHLASRIPFYRLGEAAEGLSAIAALDRVSVGDSFKCVGLALWDERDRRLVSFYEISQPHGCPEVRPTT